MKFSVKHYPGTALSSAVVALTVALTVALAACTPTSAPGDDTPPGNTPNPSPAPSEAPVLSREVVLSGLDNPWDLAFTASGDMFLTEKCRGLSVRRADGSTTRLFGTAGSSLTAPDLVCQGQSGMHGVALDPDFASNRTVFVFMSSNIVANPRTNRVIRLQLNEGLTTASNRVDIITDIVFKHSGNAHGSAGAHSGGRIQFGPDGFLYVATGDNHNGAVPQSPTLLGGKVLRVDRNGNAAPGNNAPAGFDARIFTYGHRNVQGITFSPGTGQPFAAEHGPNHSDEVTPLVAGGNGGWDPQNRPALDCRDGYCGYAGNATTMPMTDLSRFPNAMPPSWQNNGASQGMGPATFLVGDAWKAWNGRLAVGLMRGQRVVILALNSSGMTTATANASLPGARFRSLVQSPDGKLWIATDGGEIWRVTPQ